MKKIILLIITLFIISSTSKAQRWESVDNVPITYKSNYWLDIYFLPANQNYGWVCGFNGLTMRTTDGGNSWSGSAVSRRFNLESIHFPTQLIGYTSGDAGVYKTVNGGMTWMDVTPPSAITIWGLYFVDADYGIAIGGGCTTNRQQFWLTTNGGVSWSVFEDFEPNSGLTDAIIYDKNGLGYAVSSGLLWITNDGGKTWNIHKSSGTKLWQEEITHSGNSFLFPYAGTTCGGGGQNGGMRFSVNGGDTWRDFNTGRPMFGAFLINSTTGWACGDGRSVYYTSDGGANWQNKNCGIDETANLDDIWFRSPDDGWVVGDGIYRMTEDENAVSRDIIEFKEACETTEQLDTLSLYNYSFNNVQAEMSLSGDITDFTVLSNPNITLSSCGSMQIAVRFNPKSFGQKNATLNIVFNPGTQNEQSYNVLLVGNVVESDAAPNTTVIEVNPLKVGETKKMPVIWTTSNEYETITSIQIFQSKPEIVFEQTAPIKIFQNGIITYFAVQPSDTGWFESEFKFTIAPCNVDTSIKVRVYGVSPIITSDTLKEFPLFCDTETIQSIEIKNTGNDDLIISGYQIDDPHREFTFISWSDNLKLPFNIQPGKSVFADVKYTYKESGDEEAFFIIQNNDSARKTKNSPWIIHLKGLPSATNLASEYNTIEFGDVCLDDTKSKQFKLFNKGNIDANSIISLRKGEPFKLISPQENFIVRSNDSVIIDIAFTPTELGEFYDTLRVYSETCVDSLDVIIHGFGVSSELAVLPSKIIDYIKLNKYYEYSFWVYNLGNRDTEIINIIPNIPDSWVLEVLEPTDTHAIKASDSALVKVRISSTVRGTLSGTFCIETNSVCDNSICAEIILTASDRSISATESINFGLQKCLSEAITEKFRIYNNTPIQDTISQIYLKNGNNYFRLINLPQLDYLIEGDDNLELEVEFNSLTEEGSFRDTILVASKYPGGQTLEIPIAAEFKTASSFLLSPLDDSVIENKYYFKDLGEFEICDAPLELSFSLENLGLLDDSLSIAINSNASYSISSSILNINSLARDSFYVYFNPAELLNGENAAEILISSSICPNLITIELNANRIDPVLTYKPNLSLDMGELWFGDETRQTITITNNTTVNKKINQIYFENNAPVLSHDANLPIELAQNESTQFDVIFSAVEEGTFSDSLVIEEESACLSTHKISIKAYVPEEIYEFDILLDDHYVILNDTVLMNMELRNPIPLFKTDKYTFEISYDKLLLWPHKLWIKHEDKYREIPFTNFIGKIVYDIDEEIAQKYLAEADTIAQIEFLTLGSVPDKTPVILDTIINYRNKDFYYTKKDGSVQITGYCVDEVLLRIRINASFEAKVSEVILNDNLNIIFSATDKQNLELSLMNVIGENLFFQAISLPAGESISEINVSNIPSGMYIITIKSEFGVIHKSKLVLVK